MCVFVRLCFSMCVLVRVRVCDLCVCASAHVYVFVYVCARASARVCVCMCLCVCVTTVTSRDCAVASGTDTHERDIPDVWMQQHHNQLLLYSMCMRGKPLM